MKKEKPMFELYKVKCGRCGHEWSPRVVKPLMCPNCRKRNWKLEKKEEGGAK